MKKFPALVLMVIFSVVIRGQGTAGGNAKYEYRQLIDLPTAGILEKGFVGATLNIMPAGVVIAKLEVGVFENFSFGLSFGGANVIGTGAVKWYRLPGVNLRARILDETKSYPALTLGFDSQGKGSYFSSLNRYEIKSPGFFVAASKNFEFLGYLSLHAVVNYSLERKDGDKDLDFGIGAEKTLGARISVIAEYDFGINDNNAAAVGKGNGYLNFGLRWSAGQGFTLGIDFRNLLENKKINSNKADRGIFVEYIKAI